MDFFVISIEYSKWSINVSYNRYWFWFDALIPVSRKFRIKGLRNITISYTYWAGTSARTLGGL